VGGVARAVGGQPSILLADSPPANLDSQRRAVMELAARTCSRQRHHLHGTHRRPLRRSMPIDIVHLLTGLIVEEEAGTNRRAVVDEKREAKMTASENRMISPTLAS